MHHRLKKHNGHTLHSLEAEADRAEAPAGKTSSANGNGHDAPAFKKVGLSTDSRAPRPSLGPLSVSPAATLSESEVERILPERWEALPLVAKLTLLLDRHLD